MAAEMPEAFNSKMPSWGGKNYLRKWADFPIMAANKPLTSTLLALLGDTSDHPQHSDPRDNRLCNWLHPLPSQDDSEAATDLPESHGKSISLLLRTWLLSQDRAGGGL